MRRARWIGLLLLLVLLAGPLGLEAVVHDAHHGESDAPDDCPLCVAAKTLAVESAPQAPVLGAEQSSQAPPLPAVEPGASLAPDTARGRSPPTTS
jgi:hypothetical protein